MSPAMPSGVVFTHKATKNIAPRHCNQNQKHVSKAVEKNILLVQSTLLFLIGHVDPVLPEPSSIDEKDVFPRGSFRGPSMAPRSNGPRPVAADSHRRLNNFTMRTFRQQCTPSAKSESQQSERLGDGAVLPSIYIGEGPLTPSFEQQQVSQSLSRSLCI
ncbi:hypothetical protein BT67DRAFT_71273 [Trichocladium antarcticum]|uniref:Uncharacterized protein n=1 Tax=Trichocladium antarcticum TaxID=1450529 RepID=A0AAN6ZBB0_9PEZI|nr:hypothetical protein BT67DRAFT_71273 [Trichocladium antarcticum]